MGPMGRRTVALLAAFAVALSSCSVDAATGPAGAAAPPSVTTSPPSVTASPPPVAKSPTASPARSAGGRVVVPPVGEAPARNFAVKVRKLRLSRGADRPLPTTVWYPDGAGPFPVIVFSHGLGSAPDAYSALLSRWARAGFVVAAAAYPHTSAGVADFNVIDLVNQPADASRVLTEVIARGNRAGDPLRGRVDAAHVAAAGHSAGGITTLGLLAGSRDDRLAAAVVLAGRQVLPGAFAGPELPVLFVHGKRDAIVEYAAGRAAFDAIPWPKGLLTIPDGDHVLTGGRDFEVVDAATTDFWRWSLYGDPDAKQRLEARQNLDSTL
jgi:dienelactone hydrolase